MACRRERKVFLDVNGLAVCKVLMADKGEVFSLFFDICWFEVDIFAGFRVVRS